MNITLTEPRAVTDADAARALLAHADAVLVDWDGCIAIGNKPQTAAVRFLQKYQQRIAIVSNNSTNLPEDFVITLRAAKVSLSGDRIVLAGVEALHRAAELNDARVLILGESRMKAYARQIGIHIVNDGADTVVLMRDTRFSYAKLERATNCLRAGARLIVSNPDRSHPGKNGKLVPETGALLAALLASCGCTPDVEIIGKPEPRLFERARQSLDAGVARTIMIGDNPATDVAGATALGLQSILIGPVQFEALL